VGDLSTDAVEVADSEFFSHERCLSNWMVRTVVLAVT